MDQQTEQEHELESSWTYWYDRTERGASASEFKGSLKKIASIQTIEQFWGVFEEIPQVEELSAGVTYHLMRGEIEPMWEHPGNSRGGTWRFKMNKKDSSRVWEEMVMAVIGEQFSSVMVEEDHIVGLSLAIRERDDVLQVWNHNSLLADKENNALVDKVTSLFASDPVAFTTTFYKANQNHQKFDRKLSKSDQYYTKSSKS